MLAPWKARQEATARIIEDDSRRLIAEAQAEARRFLVPLDETGETDAGSLNAGLNAAYLENPCNPRWVANTTYYPLQLHRNPPSLSKGEGTLNIPVRTRTRLLPT